jgi:hypothetical protein
VIAPEELHPEAADLLRNVFGKEADLLRGFTGEEIVRLAHDVLRERRQFVVVIDPDGNVVGSVPATAELLEKLEAS